MTAGAAAGTGAAVGLAVVGLDAGSSFAMDSLCCFCKFADD